MSETQELGQSALVANQAVGYSVPKHGSWLKAPVQNGAAMYAAAGIVSTATDMATYMTALLSGQILDPATYQLMWTSTSPASASRGLGWDNVINSSTGTVEVTKNGRVPGILRLISSSTLKRTAVSSSPSIPAMKVRVQTV